MAAEGKRRADHRSGKLPIGGRRRSPSSAVNPSTNPREIAWVKSLVGIGAALLLFALVAFVGAASRRKSRGEMDRERYSYNDERSNGRESTRRPPIHYELVEEDGPPRSTTASPAYRKYRAVRRDPSTNQNVSVSFGEWARGLSQPENAAQLSEVIVDASLKTEDRFQAVFWETPPVRPSSLEVQPMEFVLVDAPTLQRFARTADPSAFADHFRTCDTSAGEQSVGCVFESLGRDAILISPRPKVTSSESSNRISVNGAHLMSYLQTASGEHRNSFWKTVGETYVSALQQHPGSNDNNDDDAPRWLSTSGLGVAYLHVRVDRRPKYYTYDPYKQA